MDITFTESAKKYLASLLARQDVPNIGVRLFVMQPGMPQAESCLAYCRPGESKDDDEVLQLDEFTVFVEKISVDFLKDAVIDFVEDDFGGQLTIKAPNAKVPLVGENASLEDRVNYILQVEINPTLASHGGYVNLVRIETINHQLTAILQFGGGCQGCGLASVTLKERVQSALLAHCTEIQAIQDVTDHSNREQAYYK